MNHYFHFDAAIMLMADECHMNYRNILPYLIHDVFDKNETNL